MDRSRLLAALAVSFLGGAIAWEFVLYVSRHLVLEWK